ncbi:hypothetical protein WR25_00959 [Diploscapter pachys]|uniref:Exonuclease domain-containing protein n=1 Tax=Diploscapter pachys TaxID=2018661 RepID=A0A2A2LA49_9BILA|nr:hypothetical protein WR25_00959 [Diploscapter pachys]
MKNSKPVAQSFDYLLVLGFETTCIENGQIQPVKEIIEFSVIAISTDGWRETAAFHKYIKPTINPTLTTFCTSLTRIEQETVNNGKKLFGVLKDFDSWLEENQIKQTNFTFVTYSDWDLKFVLSDECRAKKIKIPEYFTKWIDLKKAYAEHTGEFPEGGLGEMLVRCNLTFEGRLRRGINNTRNVCRVVETLYKSGYKFRSTLRSVVKDARTPTGERTYWSADGTDF